jgi:hypothetical protein
VVAIESHFFQTIELYINGDVSFWPSGCVTMT